MAFIGYFIAMAAWITWIYRQYKDGDRPVAYGGFVASLLLGGFEYGKGILTLMVNLPVYGQAALVSTVLTLTVLYVYSSRNAGAVEQVEAEAAQA